MAKRPFEINFLRQSGANGGIATKTSLARTNNSASYAGLSSHDQFHQIWIILGGNSLLRYPANKVHTFRPYTCPIWHRSKNDVLNSSPLIFPLLTAKQTQKLKCNHGFFCTIFYVPATATSKSLAYTAVIRLIRSFFKVVTQRSSPQGSLLGEVFSDDTKNGLFRD